MTDRAKDGDIQKVRKIKMRGNREEKIQVVERNTVNKSTGAREQTALFVALATQGRP